MFIISKAFRFEAAHRLSEHDGACRHLHGHSYTFRIEVRGGTAGDGPKRNMVMDYADISAAGKAVQVRLDHAFLNEVLGEGMTTAEYLSKWIYDEVAREFPDLWAVEVCETETTSCRYCPQESRVFELGTAELNRVRQRLFASIQVGEAGECWPFLGSRDERGYGYCRYTVAGTCKAHRLVMWLAGHEIDGRVVLHSCDNPPCCNPSHLRVGDHAENERDKDSRGRRPRGGRHYAAVLTDEQVRELWAGYCRQGRSQEFARRWSDLNEVSRGVVSNIVRGWNWNHITGLPKRQPRGC